MSNTQKKKEIVLVGAGIMSATLGAMLKEVAPDWNIKVFEKLGSAGEESSNVWNNAGTGHAALCELNYTPESADGSIDTAKAVSINEQFQVSKQFWAYLVDNERISDPQDFIMPLPHLSFVQGAANVHFLKNRYITMAKNPLFKGIEFSTDHAQIKEWMPLIMKDRTSKEPIAATKTECGTDIDFGKLTKKVFNHLSKNNAEVHYRHSVDDLKRNSDGSWEVKVHSLDSGKTEYHNADFVFVGSGGGSLHLLQKSGIPEGKQVGGFPISGVFLVCNNQEVVEQHNAKVYGKAKVGAPPMSVPHLDTRFVDNKKALVFGPFAGFSPKFLKSGSMLDLATSVKTHNLVAMASAGLKNLSLIKYLVEQLMLSKEQRMNDLRDFIPSAKSEDWDIVVAGQRVQIIKAAKGGGGIIQFGTEVINAADGSIAALLGASPGASTAVNIMLGLMDKCFPEYVAEWEPKIKEMIPSHGVSLRDNLDMLKEIDSIAAQALGICPEMRCNEK